MDPWQTFIHRDTFARFNELFKCPQSLSENISSNCFHSFLETPPPADSRIYWRQRTKPNKATPARQMGLACWTRLLSTQNTFQSGSSHPLSGHQHKNLYSQSHASSEYPLVLESRVSESLKKGEILRPIYIYIHIRPTLSKIWIQKNHLNLK